MHERRIRLGIPAPPISRFDDGKTHITKEDLKFAFWMFLLIFLFGILFSTKEYWLPFFLSSHGLEG